MHTGDGEGSSAAESLIGSNFVMNEESSSEFGESDSSCSQSSASDCENSSESEDDDDSSFRFPSQDTKIYAGANMSVFESDLVLITLFKNCPQLSYELMNIFIKILKRHLPSENVVAGSVKVLKKKFSGFDFPKYDHKFCTVCYSLVGNNSTCSDCANSRIGEFCTFDVDKQISNFFLRGNFSSHLVFTKGNNNQQNTMKNITDGALFKKINLPPDGKNLTLMLYTDGLQAFNSSKLSAWPIFFAINELPYEKRFLPQNLLLAGLWWDLCKADFNTFLVPLFDQMKRLRMGIKVHLADGKEETVRLILVCCTCDKPAKAKVTNMKGHNGRYSCPKCLIRGDSVLDEGAKRKKLCFSKIGSILRNSKDSIMHGRRATITETLFGYKGLSNYSLIVPDFIGGLAEDLMHTLYGGIVKKMLEFWFSVAHNKKSYSCHSSLDKVKARLKAVKPPNFVVRRLRSLDELAYWKTAEYKNFCLYYAIPLLHDIMNPQYLAHFYKLVAATFLLAGDEISGEDIGQASNLLIEYVQEFKSIYGEKNMTSNVHTLLHLAESARQMGPLYHTCCFPLESILGILKKFILGSNKPSIKVYESYKLIQCLPFFEQALPPDSDVTGLINDLKYGSAIRTEISEYLYILGTTKPIKDFDTSFFKGGITKFDHIQTIPNVIKLWTYHRLETKNCTVVGSCYENSKLYNSSFVETFGGRIFKVETFVTYKLCLCRNLCSCIAYHEALGYFCNETEISNVPKNKWITGIYIERAVGGIDVGDIKNLCAFFNVNNTLICCRRLNSAEKE